MTQKTSFRSGYESQETALIVHPELRRRKTSDKITRALDDVLEEAEGLARAIDLQVLDVLVFNIQKIQPGAYFGSGQRQEVADTIQACHPGIVIVNCNLSPVQQRNLEKEWQVKVIDRTGLILEIFGARAQTKEGRLQVELAALDYQRSRLVRSWTHLERQRGGAGFMGGPGETQIELDRRMISDKIVRLKRELEDVRRTRHLARAGRERVPFPILSLVGYTNAGKSTLFNHLTKAGVFAEDLPFATLDPTMRKIELPGGQDAIIADTVGFISNLPTHLIESFRATLEQINQADVIVHVIDIARPDYAAQIADVVGILEDLGIEYEKDERIIEAWNKADLLSRDALGDFKRQEKFNERAVLLSAVQGKGVDSLLDKVADILNRSKTKAAFRIPISDGKALSWLHAHAEILERKDDEEEMKIKILISPADLGKFTAHYGYSPQKTRKKR